MKLVCAFNILLLAAEVCSNAAFTTLRAPGHAFSPVASSSVSSTALPTPSPRNTRLNMSRSGIDDDEVERLRSMAATLRAEAATLEVEQSQAKATAVEKAFREFDVNQDGSVNIEELKAGLEKVFKRELPEKSVQQLMTNFDKSGDGALQLDEFVGVEQFRNQLDSLARDERTKAMQKANVARTEQEIARELDEQLALINDKPPTTTDKLVSTLPYLFPFLDSLQYANFLVLANQDNPLAQTAGLLYALYRSIPLGGFIAFFSLSLLSGRPGINRLVRYNMQQAIFLDIALFFPGLIAALVGLSGVPMPPNATSLFSDAVFVAMLATIMYSTGSSLLGKIPDSIPFISKAANERVPTADSIKQNSEFFLKQMGMDLSGLDREMKDMLEDGENLTNTDVEKEEKEKVNKN